MHKARIVGSLLSIVAACGFAQPAVGDEPPDAPSSSFVPRPGVKELSGRLLVRPVQQAEWVRRGLSGAQAAQAEQRANLRIAGLEISRIEAPDIRVLMVPPGQSETTLASMLMATGEYEYAEPDWIVYPCDATPDDPGYGLSWHLQKIQAFGAWERTTGDGSIICAFVDTGIDLTHPDLAANLVPGYNSVTQLTQAQGGAITDINGHGTSVAGVAAAVGNNAQGGAGVGWDLKIMPIRASNWSSGSAFMSDILWGAAWAAYHGARVINVSYGGVDSASAQATGLAIKDQYGGLLFWAAGNSGQELTFDWPDVVIVGATDASDVLAPDSNWGAAIDVVAPGVDLYTTGRGGGYGWVGGTSYSTPIAAATAALGWSLNPGLSANQVLARLGQSSIDLGDPGDDPVYGRGRVNAYRMVQRCDPITFSENGGATLPAVQGVGGPLRPGLIAAYYDLPHHLTPPWGFSSLEPLAWDLAATLTVPEPTPPPGFGADYLGYLWVPRTAPYTFSLGATDGACVWIDDRVAVWANDLPAGNTRAGTLSLEVGWHRIHCALYSQVSSPSLSVGMRGGGLGAGIIGPQSLFHTGPMPIIPR